MNKYYTFFLGICLFAACNEKTKPSKAENPVIQNQGVKIDYTDTHTGDTTLLFVHGWCINKTYWYNQAAYFKNKYRVVTMDLPGFGKSGKNREIWNTTAFGKDVTAVITQLKLKNVILIGHSMAGDIIVQATINTPKQVVGLIGIDNFKHVGVGSKPSKQDSDAYKKAIDSLRHNFKKIAFEYFNQDLFYKTTSRPVKERILNDVAHADPDIASACMEQDNFDEATELLKTKKKLCLINSDVKPTNTIGLKAKKIPFQIWYVHATGHFPMIEKPREFNILLAQAIQKIR
ncbi:MAG TPA: alpha/beta hydrolase [Mucilaginibacter sp.]